MARIVVVSVPLKLDKVPSGTSAIVVPFDDPARARGYFIARAVAWSNQHSWVLDKDLHDRLDKYLPEVLTTESTYPDEAVDLIEDIYGVDFVDEGENGISYFVEDGHISAEPLVRGEEEGPSGGIDPRTVVVDTTTVPHAQPIYSGARHHP